MERMTLVSPLLPRDPCKSLISPLARTDRASRVSGDGLLRLFCTQFVPKNCTFLVCGNDFCVKTPFFGEKSQKNLVMSKKSCTFAPAFEKKLYGGLSSVGRASDCGSECQGFEPLIPPA